MGIFDWRLIERYETGMNNAADREIPSAAFCVKNTKIPLEIQKKHKICLPVPYTA